MFLNKAVNMEGRHVNYKSTKGLGGAKSASQGLASSQTLGTDAGMQLSNQLDGISPDDLLSFTGSVSALNQVNSYKTYFEIVKQNYKDHQQC